VPKIVSRLSIMVVIGLILISMGIAVGDYSYSHRYSFVTSDRMPYSQSIMDNTDQIREQNSVRDKFEENVLIVKSGWIAREDMGSGMSKGMYYDTISLMEYRDYTIDPGRYVVTGHKFDGYTPRKRTLYPSSGTSPTGFTPGPEVNVGPCEIWMTNSPMYFTPGYEVDKGITLRPGTDTGFTINPEFAAEIGK